VKIGEKYLNIKAVCVYGGAPKEPQVSALSQGAEVVIATPGRLLDLHNEGNCPLDMIQTLVLDEADRMLDMGFERDIRVTLSFN
jgi:superfamily II DNA/RNA helicase